MDRRRFQVTAAGDGSVASNRFGAFSGTAIKYELPHLECAIAVESEAGCYW
nr:hypothetical protein [Nitrosomonas supralitoralis]